MTFVFCLFISFAAHAGFLGPENYYVVQKDNQEVYAKFEDGVTELMILHRGQVVHLDGLYNARLAVDRVVNGRTVHGEIVVPRAEIPKVFGAAMNPSKGSDQSLAIQPSYSRVGKVIRLDATPADLARTNLPARDSAHTYIPASQVSGTLDVQSSKLMDYGRGRFLLVHYACLSQPRSCGWIRNDQLARGDRRLTATSESGPDSVPHKAPCPSREPAAKVATFASDVLAVLKKLPGDEQTARQKVEDAVGACVSKAPSALSAYSGKMIRGRKQPGTNLYDVAPRTAAESAFAKISGSAAKVRVRAADGSTRAMNKEDFVTIDAFARTLFGEMRSNSCLGKPHIEAVARTIMNRTNDLGGWAIAPGPKAKTPIMKVILADQQYSVWNNEDEVGSNVSNHNSNVKSSWCPAKNEAESEAWNRCLDTAMHAYLDQKAFLDETKSLSHVTSYTSGRSKWPGHKPVTPNPSIYGATFNDASCMKFWIN